MAAQAAAAAAGAALQADKIIKKSTDLPWYYGIPAKETISASDLITRLEAAAGVSNWDTDDKKIRELYLLFGEEALLWWKCTKRNEDCNIADWASVKKAFLLNYEPTITARTTCTNLADLVQRPNEVANRYHHRLFATFDKLQSTYPTIEKPSGLPRSTPLPPTLPNKSRSKPKTSKTLSVSLSISNS